MTAKTEVFCLYCKSYGVDCNPDPEDWSEPCEYFESELAQEKPITKREVHNGTE